MRVKWHYLIESDVNLRKLEREFTADPNNWTVFEKYLRALDRSGAPKAKALRMKLNAINQEWVGSGPLPMPHAELAYLIDFAENNGYHLIMRLFDKGTKAGDPGARFVGIRDPDTSHYLIDPESSGPTRIRCFRIPQIVPDSGPYVSNFNTKSLLYHNKIGEDIEFIPIPNEAARAWMFPSDDEQELVDD